MTTEDCDETVTLVPISTSAVVLGNVRIPVHFRHPSYSLGSMSDPIVGFREKKREVLL